MAKFTIEQHHALEPAQVKQRLEALSTRLADKYEIKSVWRSASLATFSRTGASGEIRVSEGRVTIEVDLNLLLRPLRDKIEGRIRDELRTALAPAPAADPAGTPGKPA